MTSWGTRCRGRAAVAVVGVVLLGACGDGSSAEPITPAAVTSTDTPTPVPAPTVEPTAVATDRAGEPLVPPERRAAMDNDDVAGAQAAAEYFMEVSGYAVRSQDLAEFSALCDPESLYCTAVIDEVEADIAAGNVTVGGANALTTIAVDPPGEHPFYTVWGTLVSTPFTVYDASGAAIAELEGDDGLDIAVAVEYQADGQWIVRGARAGVVQPS